MRTARRTALHVAALVLSLVAAARAGDPELSVRVLKIKASGKAAKGARAEVAKELDAVKAQLAVLPLGYARYDVIGSAETKRGTAGKILSFELSRERSIETRASLCARSDRIRVRIAVFEQKKKDDPRTEICSIDAEVKDGETSIVKSEVKHEGGDVLFAVTASSSPL